MKRPSQPPRPPRARPFHGPPAQPCHRTLWRSARATGVVWVLLLTTVALTSAFSAPAGAHIPVLEPAEPSDAPPSNSQAARPFPAAIELPDPSISRAVYGTLAEAEAFDVYHFRVAEPVELPVGILVPKRDELASFRPSFALIGPALVGGSPPADAHGLPAPIRERLETTAESDVTGEGLTVLIGQAAADDWGSFFEPFSFERYHEGPELRVPFEPERDYYVLVFHPGGAHGDYVLGLGTKEAFGPEEVARSVVAVGRIKLGLYGQGELRWGALIAAAAVGVGVLVIAAAALVFRRRRSRRRAT